MYLLEDFLLLDRGESLWEERDDVSFEYERSERSDLSERGDDERPLLLLLRGGLADPLCRRFLSTVGDKYLSDKKINKYQTNVLCSKLQFIGQILQHASCFTHLSFRVGVSSFSFSFFRSFNRVSAFSFSFFSLSFSRSSFSFSFSYSQWTQWRILNSDSCTWCQLLKTPFEPNSIPFVVICPCSARPVPECSARAFWVVSQTPAHPGTS